MACFLISTAESIAAAAAAKAVEKKEEQRSEANEGKAERAAGRLPFSHKLKWLRNMLWGGSALLAFEHVWHGEIVPWFPFLTAAADPADASQMLHEMATVGAAMAGLITAVWLVMLGVSALLEKRAEKEAAEPVKES